MMAKEKKKVPNLRFKGFTDDWEQRKLGGLFSTITDYVANGSFKSLRDHVKTYDTPNYAYMIRLIDASNDWKGPWLYTDRNGYSFLRKTSLKTNDVLLSNVGAGVGKTFLVPNLDKPMTLAPNSVLLRSSLFNERYLFYLINTCKNKNKILSMVGISAQPKLNKTDFKEVKVNTSLQKQEQLKIEETLSLIENNITLQQQKLDLLKQLKKGLLQKMFADKDSKRPVLRFKGFHDDWEQRKLGEISTSFSGGTPSVKNKSYYGGKIPFIRSAEIHKDKTELFITENGLKNSSAKLIKKGTLLYALYGATSGEVDVSNIDGAINQAIMAIFLQKDNVSFIKYYLEKNKYKIIAKYLQGGQGNLSASIIKSVHINLPFTEEQLKISNLIKKVESLISLQQQKLAKYQSIKKSLLQQMFI